MKTLLKINDFIFTIYLLIIAIGVIVLSIDYWFQIGIINWQFNTNNTILFIILPIISISFLGIKSHNLYSRTATN